MQRELDCHQAKKWPGDKDMKYPCYLAEGYNRRARVTLIRLDPVQC